MRYFLLMIAVVVLVGGCASTPEVVPYSPDNEAYIEAAIRGQISKPKGKLTKADLEKVTYLDFSSNKLTDVTGLEKLTKLEELKLGDNQLTNVKGLENLTQLTTLHLYKNKLTNVKGLEKLTQLEGLNLYGNKLTNVKGLEKLTKLERLDLGSNPDLTKAQIDELRKALPKCIIGGIFTK